MRLWRHWGASTREKATSSKCPLAQGPHGLLNWAIRYAIPLYLQAIGLLVPLASSKKKATVEERCRGGQLMNNLAELSIRGEPTDAKRKQAEAWARQGLATIESTKALGKGSPEELMLCDEALAAVLFNLGSLLEVSLLYC